MGDFAELEQRIERLSARAATGSDPALLPEIDAALSEGYARALMAEGRLKQLDRRLERLIEGPDPADIEELRSLMHERRQLAGRLERVRARLAVMREGFVALRPRRAET